MQNFVFHNPTKVLFGRQTLAAIGSETRLLGKRALLVYGQESLRASGTLAQIKGHLHQAGVSCAEFGGIQANPLLSKVRQGILKVRAEEIEVIIGAGGGSVIDTAKAIAAGSMVAHDVWKFFTGKKSVRATLPLLAVSTLPGSGSEMNHGMVLTHDQSREKFGFGHRLLHPQTAILDPELTFSLPAEQTAYGAVDAICHILEFYLSTQDPDTPVQDRLMEGLINNGMEACERCLADPCDYEARASLMWTACLALNGLTAAGLGRIEMVMHLLEHSLSGLYDTPHGAGLAALLPGWLHHFARSRPERLAQLGAGLFPRSGTGDDRERRLNHCIEAFLGWLEAIQVPTSLEALQIPSQDHPRIAAHTSGLAKVWRMRQYSPAFFEDILQGCR
ncbi:iron-containing alcohol dehydrogenase [Desulfogranum mediterraneum]|uniref:iron-containing alcohol dehydrogenase n=1 Tax=Desulfogranum mediterraneum TaxID=160661 RepID=UPI000422D192|nr:iron-containing alcohol dehydrogenase [Desulfogranum mediterraneum]